MPQIALPASNSETTFSLVLYDGMCRAIEAAFDVDEAKDIRDKARAFEVYAQQAKNIENERRACEIRLRAERKAGELLRDMEKARPGPPIRNRSVDTTEYRGAPTLRDLGISKQQSSDWQRLASVPKDDFESALSDQTIKPTTSGIIRETTPPDPEIVPVSREGLWLWGRLSDFERDGLLR